MATKKISELTEVTSPTSTDVFPIVNDGETKKVQLTNVKTVLGVTQAETDINNAEAVIGNETDTYSASSTYALGDLVIYNSLLYKCTTAITVAEAWNSAKWTQVSLTSLAITSDIIESGRNNNKMWIKFRNGTMIQIVKTTISNQTMSAEGSIFRSPMVQLSNFNEPFIEVYGVNHSITAYNNNYMWLGQASEVQLAYPGWVMLFAGSNNATWTMTITSIAFGKWK